MSEALKYSAKLSFVFLSWIPVVYTFNEHVFHISRIEGSSMSPTFNPSQLTKDYVLIYKWNLKKPGNLKVDDVILFRSPTNPEKIYTKRIKGVQGDEIKTRFPYPKHLASVPRNHLWVEGDNIHSIDSNTFGPISSGLVIGKAISIIWPLSRIGSVPVHGREARYSNVKTIDEI